MPGAISVRSMCCAGVISWLTAHVTVQFRAIAEHIYQSQAHHILVRDECLDFVVLNREEFEPFICASPRL